MKGWLRKWWRAWTGFEQADASVMLLREHLCELSKENQILRPENDKLRKLNHDLSRVSSVEAVEKTALKKKADFADAYFAGMPQRGEGKVEWTKDDFRDLATWAESPAGMKLLTQLANRLDDYEAAAIRMAGPSAAYALCARARGFRDAIAELKQFTAAGPSPANHEQPEFPLPAELEHLRG